MGMAQALTGWTGDLSVTIGATEVEITPRPTTSAIELAIRIGDVLRGFGLSGIQYASATGVLVWEASSTFTVEATGVIASRMNLAASTSGATVTGAGAHLNGFYPGHGMSVVAPLLPFAEVAPMADGAHAPGLLSRATPVRLRAFSELSDVWALEAAFGTDQPWDLWALGEWRGRLKVSSVVRQRVGHGAGAVPCGALDIGGNVYSDAVRA